MVWLAKSILETLPNGRVLIITDRTELDDQIEKVFNGVNEDIKRTQSGSHLLQVLTNPAERLICSLVHKFGRSGEREDEDTDIDDYDDSSRRLAVLIKYLLLNESKVFLYRITVF